MSGIHNLPEDIKILPCPTCNTLVEWKPENKYRPFCSERCKLIDFGEWASEKNSLPVEESADNLSFNLDDEDLN